MNKEDERVKGFYRCMDVFIQIKTSQTQAGERVAREPRKRACVSIFLPVQHTEAQLQISVTLLAHGGQVLLVFHSSPLLIVI